MGDTVSYSPTRKTENCTVCEGGANIIDREFHVGTVVDCERCGNYTLLDFTVAREVPLPYKSPREKALASYTIRRMQSKNERADLTRDFFFKALPERSLPTPQEQSDNLLTWMAQQADGTPGKTITVEYTRQSLWSIAGVTDHNDLRWVVDNLSKQDLVHGREDPAQQMFRVQISGKGWQRIEELRHAYVASNFAFFARQFANSDLDILYENCLRPAVKATGYYLRTVTQRAGLVDSVIEDEIRRCRFLIADLSDDNAGAYWEAGFAEGLGKPVIYICCAKNGTQLKRTHFDTNHRHTVRWDLASLDETAKNLKAVIRNTLLGYALQND